MKKATKKKFITFDELDPGRRKKTVDTSMVGKVSAESVKKHTGKDWKQWLAILEKANARSLNYQELVAYLKTKWKLTPWWQQGVALGFEIATGRRETGQDAKGKYMVTATKTMPVDAREVWEFVTSEEGLELWLKPLASVELKPKGQFETEDGFFGEVRTLAKYRRLRLFWQDPLWSKHTVLEFMLVARPKKKSILIFNHTGIQDTRVKEKLRVRWREAADRIHVRLTALE